MTGFEHLISSYDVRDALDDIASSDPPAYLKRCFAEGCSAAHLSRVRVQQLAVCAMVLDAVCNDRDYDYFERELVSDWRAHHGPDFQKLKDLARQALARVIERGELQDPESRSEFESLQRRVASG